MAELAQRLGFDLPNAFAGDGERLTDLLAAQAFQKLGEVDLADADPNPVDVFLFYDHPTMLDRVQFSLTYDPWQRAGQGEFAK